MDKLIEENKKLKRRIDRRERIASELLKLQKENRELKKKLELMNTKFR